MKTLSSYNLKGKIVLLRSDLNSDNKGKKIILGERIREACITIKELKKKKAKIVIIAHQGQKGKENYLSLKGHAKYLNKFTKVKFVNDIVGKKAIKAIKSLKNGEAILLENVRFLDDELHPEKGMKNKLIMNLVPLVDYYCNDSFSVCHRKHTSIIGFPKYLKNFAGLLLEKEVKALKKMSLKKCLYILGGAKPKDYLSILKKAKKDGNKIIAVGLFGQSVVISRGKKLGAQDKYLRKEAELDQGLIKKLKKYCSDEKRVITPFDFAVEKGNKRVEIDIVDFPCKNEIFDIGEKSIIKFEKVINFAKSIYMKGPAGDFSKNNFSKGTISILKAISKNNGYSLIGGGHLVDAIKKSGIRKSKFSHISLSGGALLKYLAGEKLPGLEVLK